MSKIICQHGTLKVIVKLVSANRPDVPYFPKFIPQLQLRCDLCNYYFKTLAQTPSRIEKINEALQEGKVTFPNPKT